MSDQEDTDNLRAALRMRDKALAKPLRSTEDELLEKVDAVRKRQGEDAAVKFLMRRTGLEKTFAEAVVKKNSVASEDSSEEELENLVVEESYYQGQGICGMVLETLGSMKKQGITTSDYECSEEDINAAAEDLVELMEYLCGANISPLRLLRAACRNRKLLHDEKRKEFAEVVKKATRVPLSEDIRRSFP